MWHNGRPAACPLRHAAVNQPQDLVLFWHKPNDPCGRQCQAIGHSGPAPQPPEPTADWPVRSCEIYGGRPGLSGLYLPPALPDGRRTASRLAATAEIVANVAG